MGKSEQNMDLDWKQLELDQHTNLVPALYVCMYIWHLCSQ